MPPLSLTSPGLGLCQLPTLNTKAGMVTPRMGVACCLCIDSSRSLPKAGDQKSQEVTTELNPWPSLCTLLVLEGVARGQAMMTRPLLLPGLLSQMSALFRVRHQIL